MKLKLHYKFLLLLQLTYLHVMFKKKLPICCIKQQYHGLEFIITGIVCRATNKTYEKVSFDKGEVL